MCNCNPLLTLPLGNPGQNGTNGFLFTGTLSPTSSGILYPVGTANTAYRILTEGLVGTILGSIISKKLYPQDILYCIASNIGGNEASVGTSWIVIRGNEEDFKKHGTISDQNLSISRGNNTISGGTYNLILGEDSTINSGDHNLIMGDTISLDGDNNIVSGQTNAVTGSWNQVSGSAQTVTGSNNEVSGDSNTIISGNYNKISGTSNTVGNGSSNEVSGGGNVISDDVDYSRASGAFSKVDTSYTETLGGPYFGVTQTPGHSQSFKLQASLTTTDATPVTFKQGSTELLEFADKTAFEINGEVLVSKPSNNSVAKFKFFACGSQKTGTAVLDSVYFVSPVGVNTVQGGGPYATARQVDAGINTIDLRLVISSNKVTIEATGIALTTLYWSCTLNVSQIGWF